MGALILKPLFTAVYKDSLSSLEGFLFHLKPGPGLGDSACLQLVKMVSGVLHASRRSPH